MRASRLKLPWVAVVPPRRQPRRLREAAPFFLRLQPRRLAALAPLRLPFLRLQPRRLVALLPVPFFFPFPFLRAQSGPLCVGGVKTRTSAVPSQLLPTNTARCVSLGCGWAFFRFFFFFLPFFFAAWAAWSAGAFATEVTVTAQAHSATSAATASFLPAAPFIPTAGS